MKTTELKFPKRFEIEGLDPLKLKVKVVTLSGVQIFDNMEEAFRTIDLKKGFTWPLADKHEGQWCVRFESSQAYRVLSN